MDTSTTASAAPPAPSAHLRGFREDDAAAVRRVWRDSIVLGSPLPLGALDLRGYEELSLAWYLDPGNRAAGVATIAVVAEEGEVRGYALACLDQAAYERWVRRAAVRWAVRAVAAWPRLAPGARQFVRLRIRDGLHARRHQPPAPFPAHMHLNLDPTLRGVHIGHHLVGWMDAQVRDAGLDGFFGEVNMPRGRSVRAIEAAGATVTARVPNLTFSWLLGTPVDRCIVARPLADRTDTVPVASASTGAP